MHAEESGLHSAGYTHRNNLAGIDAIFQHSEDGGIFPFKNNALHRPHTH
jgi:hypothetical protein